MHDVEDCVPLDMAVTTLIEVKDDAPIATLPQQALDIGISGFEELVQILDPQMQLGAVLAGLCLHRCDMRLQKFNRIATGIVEYEEAFDFDCAKPLDGALCVHGVDGSLQFLNENQGRSGRATLISPPPAKTVDDCETKPLLLREPCNGR